MLGLNPATIDWERRFQSTLESDETWIVKEPSPYTASWRVFPLPMGCTLHALHWRAGGLQKVLGRFAAPPTASQVLMASEHDAADMSFTPSNFSAPTPSAEWSLLYDDPVVLGAWDTFLALAKQTTLDAARRLALAWRSDRLWIYKGAMMATPSTAVSGASTSPTRRARRPLPRSSRASSGRRAFGNGAFASCWQRRTLHCRSTGLSRRSRGPMAAPQPTGVRSMGPGTLAWWTASATTARPSTKIRRTPSS